MIGAYKYCELIVPVDVKIPADYGKDQQQTETEKYWESKKIPYSVDNFVEYNEKSVQLYHAIHEYARSLLQIW